MNVQLLTVPYDSAQRGLRMGAGPQHLLAAGFQEQLTRAGHEVHPSRVEAQANGWRAEISTGFELLRAVAVEVRLARDAGRFPLVLAGNCLTAVGVRGGIGPHTGVLWFDAHGDFNTPEITTSGFLDGMALATLTGRCWVELARSVPGFQPVPEQAALLVGARDLDPREAEALAASAVSQLAPPELREGLSGALRSLAGKVDGLYVHVDLDVLDPSEGRANGYAAPGGLRLADMEAALLEIGAAAPIVAATLASYDPRYDTEGRTCRAAFAIAAAVLAAAR